MKSVGKQLSPGQPHTEIESAAMGSRLGLKAERVQESLLSIPGWSALAKPAGLVRSREFTWPAEAEAYAAFVTRLSQLHRQPVKIDLDESRVVITLNGAASEPSVRGITQPILDLAAAIG